MRELLMSRKKRFIIYLIACLLPVIAQVIITLVFAGVARAVEVGTKEYFYGVVVFGIIGILMDAGLYIASRLMRIGFMRDVLLEVRQKAFDQIIDASYGQFGKQSKEVYLSHLTNDINTFENNFFLNMMQFIFYSGIAGVSWIIIMIMDPLLGVVIGIGGLAILLLSRNFVNKTKVLQRDISDQNEEFTVGMFNILEGIEILKLNNVDKQSALRFMKQAKEVERKKFEFNVYTAKQGKILQSIGYFTFIFTLVYVCMTHIETMALAEGTLKVMLIQRSVFALAEVLPKFNVMMSSVEIYNKIVNKGQQEEIEEGTQPFVLNHQIEVEDVVVKYDERVILEDVNLTIEKGKKYLIRGASGAGKSTLLKVLARNQVADSGSIVVDTISYEAVNNSSFNGETALIHQDVFLFEDTIRNNITLYNTYSEEVIEHVVKASGLSEMMEEDLTLDTVLQENGKNLSGGQKQRIAIARALIKNVQVLFVDEATSALDSKIGRQIEEQILGLPCTVVAISHRYYEGITSKYDYVLEVRNAQVNQYSAREYFEEVLVC